MIYYIFLAIIDIGLFLFENWKELTFTVASTAIGMIIGRRIGTRLAFNYALRLMGINHKSKLERQVEHQEKQIVLLGGEPWNVERKGLKKTTIGHSFLSRWVTIFPVLFVVSFIHRLEIKKSILSRRKKKMKRYLTKLGSRKFQAYLAVTIPNLIILFGFIFGNIDLEGKVNDWMPIINLGIQMLATAVYQAAESSVDRASAKGAPNDNFVTPVEPPL